MHLPNLLSFLISFWAQCILQTVPVSGVQLFNYVINLHEDYVFLSGGNSEKGFKYIRQIMMDNHYNILQLQALNRVGPKVFGLTYKSHAKWKMMRGLYSAIYGEVNVSVSVCVEIKGDCIEK